MSDKLPAGSSAHDIANFVAEARSLVSGGADRRHARLIFAIDATQSREATWDLASGLQMQMFQAAEVHGGLVVQLTYFRGMDECRSSRWHAQAQPLMQAMEKVRCRAGHTQLGRVLRHALQQRSAGGLAAIVLIGDACEEAPDEIMGLAGQLAMVSVPVFAFHEGADRAAEGIFRDIARITRGAFFRFDPCAPKALADALRAAAIFASGGKTALWKIATQEGGALRAIADQVCR